MMSRSDGETETELGSMSETENDPWPPSDAKPGDCWGAYRLAEDGWWRLNSGTWPDPIYSQDGVFLNCLEQ